MLDERKKLIFSSIVEGYIDTGEPVGSKSLSELFRNSVSSATIRNEMAFLTERGLIGQPHTSAGRVPTYRGIRYYLDNLMKKKELSGREKQELDYIFTETEGDYERVISKAADRFADKLGCAVLGRTVPSDERRISKIELLHPFSGVFVVVLVTSDLKAHSKVCSVDFPFSQEEANLFVSMVNSEFSMMALSNVTLSFIQSAAVRMGSLGLGFSSLLFTIYELCRSADSERLFIEGEANLLSNGVLGKRELFKLKELLEKGELPGISSGNNVKTEIILGNEMPADELSSLSMVMTHYNIGKSEGSVGIIGPIRLNYSFVIPCVEYFAQSFSSYYSDKNKGEY